MKVVLAQLNPLVGDFCGNLKRIESTIKKAQASEPDLVVFSELFITGYPPRDLLERKDFLEEAKASEETLCKISREAGSVGIITGTIEPSGSQVGKGIFNSALLLSKGKVLFRQRKTLLPTYDVFDEARYFDSASSIDIFAFRREKLGITICEDAWNDPELYSRPVYSQNPVRTLYEKGATLFINISASPFSIGKDSIRHSLISNHVKRYHRPFVLVNQVGGNDDLIFDGNSMVFNGSGAILAHLEPFAEQVKAVALSPETPVLDFSPQDPIESVYRALVLGIQDYMAKCGFKKAVFGLSGGIDSTLTCCLACDALGSDKVLGVTMPSMYSSRGSIDDSVLLSRNLKAPLRIIPITSIYESYIRSLEEQFDNRPEDVTEENIQARIRGNILMALSNKFGYLTLASGNKSELSVGYCTLYGDMSGGLSVLADVPKTMVYRLARYRNSLSPVIPESIFKKPPSAELRPGQKDQDTLPPYDILDEIISLYLDQGFSERDILSRGLHPETVRRVISSIDRSEYKRRQSAPGLKVTSKAFGMGRRMPIARKYS